MLILKGHEGPVRSLSYSPDGRRLASGSEDGTARIWDVTNGKQAASLKAKNPLAVESLQWLNSIEALAFSPDGKGLALGTALGHIYVLRGARWPEKASARGHQNGVTRLLFTPQGALLSAGWDGKVQSWDGLILGEPATLRSKKEPVTGLACSPDGSRIAIGTYTGTILVLSPPQKKPIATLQTDSSCLTLAFSPDGEELASAGANGRIELWNLNTKKPRKTLEGHTWTVYGLAFTPDGRQLLSGGADGTVRLWDVEAGRERQAYRWHSRWVTCLAAAPDGLTAAAGSDDHTIVLWDIEDT